MVNNILNTILYIRVKDVLTEKYELRECIIKELILEPAKFFARDGSTTIREISLEIADLNYDLILNSFKDIEDLHKFTDANDRQVEFKVVGNVFRDIVSASRNENPIVSSTIKVGDYGMNHIDLMCNGLTMGNGRHYDISHYNGALYFSCFEWDGTMAVKRAYNYDKLIIDVKEGRFIFADELGGPEYANILFSTKEQCEANNKVKVVSFKKN